VTPEEWATEAWHQLDGMILSGVQVRRVIAAAVRAAAAEEREACATAADRAAWVMAPRDDGIDLDDVERVSKEIARTIRGRPAP
jgi:hypothetical protein